MSGFQKMATQFLEARDFDALNKLIDTVDAKDKQLADEYYLLSLIEKGVSNAALEQPFDQYLEKYGSRVPLKNFITAARVKFELMKFDDALKIITENEIPREEIDATEIAVLCLFNLKHYEPGKALVDYLLSVDSQRIIYHEWNILFSFKLADYEGVLKSWERHEFFSYNFTQRISTLGFVIRSYMVFGRLDEAQKVYDDFGLESEIEDIDAAMFIADFEKQKGNFEKTIKILQRVKKKYPDIAEIRWNLSLCQLATGQLGDGWSNYEARWEWDDFTSPRRIFSAPRWNGQANLNGKTILIWGEQGIGDQLRFLTLLPNLLKDWPGARIILELDERLIKFTRTWFPEISKFWPMGLNDTIGVKKYDDLDYQIPSGSLPAIYFNDPKSLSRSSFRMLKASSGIKKQKLGTFATNHDLIVGVSWRSMLLTKQRIGDYVSAQAFKNLIAEMPQAVGFVILQYAITDEEKRLFRDMHNVYIPTADFLVEIDENAVYAGCCDLLVSCGTVVATMAGIFGIPVISWSKFDDATNLGQEQNPWFPNRYDIRVMPNWDKVVLMDRLKSILRKYIKSHEFREAE